MTLNEFCVGHRLPLRESVVRNSGHMAARILLPMDRVSAGSKNDIEKKTFFAERPYWLWTPSMAKNMRNLQSDARFIPQAQRRLQPKRADYERCCLVHMGVVIVTFMKSTSRQAGWSAANSHKAYEVFRSGGKVAKS